MLIPFVFLKCRGKPCIYIELLFFQNFKNLVEARLAPALSSTFSFSKNFKNFVEAGLAPALSINKICYFY